MSLVLEFTGNNWQRFMWQFDSNWLDSNIHHLYKQRWTQNDQDFIFLYKSAVSHFFNRKLLYCALYYARIVHTKGEEINYNIPPTMTGTKRGTLLQSSLLSPTSSKLTSQYIVKNNLTHHYKILQNVSSCIDNSTPQSLLKSQKIRDRNNQKKRPTSRSSAYSLTKSRPASQTQGMYYGNCVDLEEDWKEAFKDDDDDDELYQIVQATLGRKPDHIFMTDYNSDDGSKDGYYSFNQSPRLSNYDGRYSASSNFPSSRQSHVFSSTSRSTKTPTKSNHLPMKDKPGDVLQSRTHVFTQPQKAFTPRILKTSKKSLLSQCKYYNPPKFCKGKAEYHKGKKEKSSNRSETPNYPEPESMTDISYISSQPSKSHSTVVEEPVPQLDLSSDKKRRSGKTKEKKDTRINNNDKNDKMSSITADVCNSKENIVLEENTDLKKTALSKYKYKLNSTDNTFKQTSTQNFSSKPTSNLYLSTTASSHLENTKVFNEINKSNECEYINFMKHVTEDILLKGLFTNSVPYIKYVDNHLPVYIYMTSAATFSILLSRAIQQVFEFHIMKQRSTLNEERMRRMLKNFLQDIGIKPESDATFIGKTSNSNELNSFPSYSGRNLSENVPKRISLASKSEQSHQKNLEKLTESEQSHQKNLEKLTESEQSHQKNLEKLTESEQSHQKNLEKLSESMSNMSVRQTEKKNLVTQNRQPEVSLARKHRHQSSRPRQRYDINVEVVNHLNKDAEETKVTYDEKLTTSPDVSNRNFTQDHDSRQNNKPVPRPRQKNSLPDISQESPTIKNMTFIVKNSDPDLFYEKSAGGSIMSKESFQEGAAPVNISLKTADNVSAIKVASEPVKSESHLTMSTSTSNMMISSSEESPRNSPELEPDSVCSESSPNLELKTNPSQVNQQSPYSPVNSLSDNQVEEQNEYEEENFESDDSDSDF